MCRHMSDPFTLPPPLQQKTTLSLRIDQPLRERLDATLRLWQLRAEAELAAAGGGKAKAVSLTFVVERLLGSAVDQVWKAHGMDGPPQSKEEWHDLEQSLRG
jgi:hypothetical protein